MGNLSRAAGERFVISGGQRPRLVHACCLRHSHSLRQVSCATGQTRPEGEGGAPSACSASSSTTGVSGEPMKTERLWKEFMSDPSQWWDNRLAKRSPKYPDFKHRRSREVLWMESSSNPPWVNSKLIARAVGKGLDNIQVHPGAPGENSRYCFCEDDDLKDMNFQWNMSLYVRNLKMTAAD